MARMPGLTQPERYHLVAPLPPLGGWRRMLALDRRGGPAGPVVLSFAPAGVLEDPGRLAALSRDAEAGGRVQHPNLVRVLGLETVEEQLALVEPYHPGTTVRALLDASGRVPVELAVRVACDAAAALSALHAVDAGDGQPLAHGALSAERIVVGEDGSSLVEGVGVGAGRSPVDDVAALAAILVEAITGEPPARPPRPLDDPGVPAPVAAVLDRALGAAPGGAFAGAAALAEALAAAFPPAPVEAVAVYVSAAAPPPTAAAGGEAPEVSAELIAPPPDAAPAAAAASQPEPTPVPDAAITFPAPGPAAARGRPPLALVLAALAVVGFGAGFGLSRLRVAPPPGAVPGAPPVAAGELTAAAAQPPAPPAAPARATPAPPAPAVARAPPPSASAPAPAAAPAPAPPPRPVPSVSVTAVPAGEILIDGKRVGRAPVFVEVKPGEHEVRLRDRAQRIDVRRKVVVKAPATPVRFQLARGVLAVTAPAECEVWVDGRRVGTGDQTVELWEGAHEVEVRRGAARAHERFELTSEVTRWTYDVTPSP